MSAVDSTNDRALDELNEQLAAFYNGTEMPAYMAHAQDVNRDWSDKPYHRLLREIVRPGDMVADLGCGTAHVYANLRDMKLEYHGFDWNQSQMEYNRLQFGAGAEFHVSSLYNLCAPTGSFDVVCTLYTVEHLSRPHRFLQEAARLTKVGGFLFILCPRFRKQGHMPSLHYGDRVMPLKDKLRSMLIIDSVQHAYRRTVYYPYALRNRFRRDKYPFLINTQPSCLRGRYYPDNDAVYFVCREEITEFLDSMRLDDETNLYANVRSIPKTVCLVIAQKTADADGDSRRPQST